MFFFDLNILLDVPILLQNSIYEFDWDRDKQFGWWNEDFWLGNAFNSDGEQYLY